MQYLGICGYWEHPFVISIPLGEVLISELYYICISDSSFSKGLFLINHLALSSFTTESSVYVCLLPLDASEPLLITLINMHIRV